MVSQTHETRASPKIASKLTEYWSPLWQCSPKRCDSDTWDAFGNLLQVLPAYDTLEVESSLVLFKQAIARLKSYVAPGIDAITAFELQTLPDSLLQQLLDVLGQYEDGFPQWFMIARPFPFNKTDSQPTSSETRPITVLSQIYRAWGAMLCHKSPNMEYHASFWYHRSSPHSWLTFRGLPRSG